MIKHDRAGRSTALDLVFPDDTEKAIWLLDRVLETKGQSPPDEWEHERSVWMEMAGRLWCCHNVSEAEDILLAVGCRYGKRAGVELAQRLMRLHIITAWRDVRSVDLQNANIIESPCEDMPWPERVRSDLLHCALLPMDCGIGAATRPDWSLAILAAARAGIAGREPIVDERAGELEASPADHVWINRMSMYERAIFRAPLKTLLAVIDAAELTVARVGDDRAKGLVAILNNEELARAVERKKKLRGDARA